MRIVVRVPNWIGDHVMAYPFYLGLREAYPHAYITWLAPDSVAEVPFTGLYNDLWKVSKPNLKALSLVQDLRKKKFDLAITLPASVSSSLSFYLAGIPKRVGFAEPLSVPFLTLAVPWRGVLSNQHKSQLYFGLLRNILGSNDAKFYLPPVSLKQKKENKIIVAPGASIALREWPYYLELLKKLETRSEFQVLVVGSDKDKKWDSLWKEHPPLNAQNLIGKTSLPDLIKLCESARLVIANDSGVAHLAATLASAPVLVLFGPGNPDYIKPLGNKVSVVRDVSLPCSPCEKPYCRSPYGFQRCLKNLDVSFIMTRVEELLRV